MATHHNFRIKNGLEVGGVLIVNSSGQLQATTISGAISATSIGVTNIVTNKVVKFNGTILDDSNITDTGSLITLGSNTAVTGKIQLNDGADIQWAGGYGSNKPLIAANSNVLNFYTHGASGGVEFALTGSAVDFKNNPATNVGTISSARLIVNSGANVSQFHSHHTTGHDDWQVSPISIRERGLNTNNSTNNQYSPNLNFHWASVVSRSLTMTSDGNFTLGEWTSSGSPEMSGNLSFLNTAGYRVNNTNVIDSSRNLTNIGTISSGAITSTGTSTFGVVTSSSYKVGASTVIDNSRNLLNIGTISSGAITSSGVVGMVTRAEIQGNGGWAYTRLKNGGNVMWDIAANPSDSSSALQFRPFGSGTNASLLSTSGNWTINGTINSGAITATTVNTGHGANELYAMNQNVRTSDSPTFQDLTVQGNLSITGDINSYNVTDLDVTDKTITVGAGQTEANSGGSGLIVDGSGAQMLWDEGDNRFEFNKNVYTTGQWQGNGSGLNTLNASNLSSGTVPEARLPTQTKYLRSDAADTATGTITFSAGINVGDLATGGITGSNYNITGVNQLSMNDPGEGINFAGSAGVTLYAIDDSTDSIMNFANATELRVNNSKVWTTSNDGGGSGLDADTVDGIQSSSFLRSDTADIASGRITLQYGETSDLNSIGGPRGVTAFHTANVGGVSNRPDTGNYATGLDFAYYDSSARSQLAAGSGGSNNTAAFYVRSEAWSATNSWTSWYKLWHTGNDGSGSGLDADTVDGKQASRIVYGDNGTATNSISGAALNPSGHLKSGFYRVASSSSTIPNATSVNFVLHTSYNVEGNTAGFDLAANDSTTSKFYLRPATGGGRGAWQTIWTSSSDGAGSGLDADLLDGQHGSYYTNPTSLPANGGNSDTVDGLHAASFLRSDASDSGASSSANYLTLGYLHNTKLLIAGGTTNFADAYNDSPWYGIGRTNVAGYHSTHNKAQIAFYWGLTLRSSQARIELSPASNGPINFGDGGTGNWAKMTSTGIYQGTSNLVWHAGNDGSGSGLDADTVDGKHKDYLMHYKGLVSGNWDTIFSQTDGHMGVYEVQNTASGHSNYPTSAYSYGGVLSWQLDNSTFKLYAPHTGQLHYQTGWNNDEYSGWRKIWDSGNDGSGSGLDADLLDGQQGSYYYPASNPSGYTTNTGTLTAETVSSTNAVTITGTKYFKPAGTATSPLGGGGSASLQAYTTGTTAAYMAFHRSGAYAINWGLDTSNTMVLGGWSSSTTVPRMSIGTNGLMVTAGQGNLWGAGNDGSGSGLDADLLDGQHGSYYTNPTSLPANGGNSDTVDNMHFHNQLGVGERIDFTVNGDAATYYPVVISGGGGDRVTDFQIFRGYGETAPSSWGSSTHMGGLTFNYKIMGSSGWGGYPTGIRVQEFGEVYRRIFGGIAFTAHTMKHVVWLRGGTATYHIWSNADISIEVNDSTSASNYVSASPHKWYSYDHSNAAYDVTVSERTSAQADSGVANEVYLNMPVSYNSAGTPAVYGIATSAYNHKFWNSSNDGSGSTLDADLLDGQQGSYYTNPTSLPANGGNSDTVDGLHAASFLRSDADDTVTAGTTYTFPASDSPAIISTRGNGGASLYVGGWSTGTNSNGIHRISSSSNLHIDSAADGNLYLNYYRGGTTYIGGANVAWHAGNDGSGSGLDADLLDGKHASEFVEHMDGSRTNATNLNSYLTSGFYNTGSGTNSNKPSGAPDYAQLIVAKGIDTGLQIYGGYNSTSLYARGWHQSGTFFSWNKLWSDNNDGSGSGLDADLLDGYNAEESAVNNSIVKRDGTASIKAHGLSLMRVSTATTGISWYNESYYNWQDYMGAPGQGSCGPNGNLTPPTGLAGVTSWALRSRMEGVSSYGWNWETGGGGGGGATATSKMSLNATTGNLALVGTCSASGFYDQNSSGFYVDPASSTNLQSVTSTPALKVTQTNGGGNNIGSLFQNSSGNFAWGCIAEYRINGTAGTDKPSIIFSHVNNTETYTVGFGYTDSNFRIKKDHGHRNGGWGTSLMTMDRSGNVTFAGNVTAYSDERLKTEIKTIENPLDTISKLRGVTFKWKESGDDSMGVIAQEVEAIAETKCLVSETPEDGNGDINPKNVAYGNMVGLLIEGMKEQQSVINRLVQDIKDLKEQIK